jgi:hypothetical protein
MDMRRPNYVTYNKGKGTNAQWLRDHISFDGLDCLIWPFARKPDGRGSVGFEGRQIGAHVLMCEFVNGLAPSDVHEVAHSCGNGHGGCVHPKHVSWKTPTENREDTVKHGNARKPGTPRFKLTEADVAEIKFLKGYLTQAERAVIFGVSNTTIAEIDRGRSWTGKPIRYGRTIPDDERPKLVLRAKKMREAQQTWESIGKALDVSRLTARVLASE